MITGAGTAGLSSSPAAPRGPAASPSCGSDTPDQFVKVMREIFEKIALQQLRDWMLRGAVTLPEDMTVDEVCAGVRFEWSSPQAHLDPLKAPPGAGGPGRLLAPFGAAPSSKGDNMASTTLRAYLCDRATCGLMGMDLAQWAARTGRPVLILPGEWLNDPRIAGSGFRSLAEADRKLAEATGAVEFPLMFEDIKSTPLAGGVSRIIRESDWLEFSR